MGFNNPNLSQTKRLRARPLSEYVILFLPIFKTSLISTHKTWGAKILRECSPPTTCQMSCVKCDMSHVMCHVSHVMCHLSRLFLGLIGVVYPWRFSYQQRLPCLVSNCTTTLQPEVKMDIPVTYTTTKAKNLKLTYIVFSISL